MVVIESAWLATDELASGCISIQQQQQVHGDLDISIKCVALQELA